MKKNNLIVEILLIIILFLTLIVAGYFYVQYQNMRENANYESDQEVAQLIKKIDKHFNLPKDDKPSVAIVRDVSRLNDQIFFNEAKNGDVLLIYPKSLKAILYRPVEDKIIDYTLMATNNENGE